MKLYADEEGKQSVRPIEAAFVSSLTQVEVPAALWRKERLGDLSAKAASKLSRVFELDCSGTDLRDPRLAVVEVSAEIVQMAARFVAMYPLTASDAIQLATAVVARNLDGSYCVFGCFDKQLRSAAAAQGFELVP